MAAPSMDKLVALCKGRGFIFAGSEIYGGLANTWDYGPLGVEFKNNVKRAWWQKFVQESKYNVGVDCAILMNREVWVASGHVGSFNDPLIDCKACKSRYRADQLIEQVDGVDADGWSDEKLEAYIAEHHVACPQCGKSDFTSIRKFNMMFKTFQGVTEDSQNEIYLRPETAQGIFVNFKNVARTTRKRVPFGIAQVGKSFRNEITPGNFTFRTREFEQMELEFFCKPGEDLEWFEYWRAFCRDWLLSLGMTEDHLRLRDHAKEELAFYSKATTDFEYLFPFGWGELWGVADRTDYDLKQHQEHSGQPMEYIDPVTNERYPDTRIVLHLHPALAPFKAAVLPLQKNKLGEAATELYDSLRKKFSVDYDETGSIGKRYRRQDEIGTPLCITVDFDTATDGCVTVRDRDTMQQERIAIADLEDYIAKRLVF